METWRRRSCLRLQRSRGKPSLMGRLAAGSSSAGRSDCLRHENRNGGDRFRFAAVLPSLPNLGSLFLHRVVKLFMGVHHVLMRLLNVVELLLLIRI